MSYLQLVDRPQFPWLHVAKDWSSSLRPQVALALCDLTVAYPPHLIRQKNTRKGAPLRRRYGDGM